MHKMLLCDALHTVCLYIQAHEVLQLYNCEGSLPGMALECIPCIFLVVGPNTDGTAFYCSTSEPQNHLSHGLVSSMFQSAVSRTIA